MIRYFLFTRQTNFDNMIASRNDADACSGREQETYPSQCGSSIIVKGVTRDKPE